MAYSTKFNPAWAKPKKTQARKQAQTTAAVAVSNLSQAQQPEDQSTPVATSQEGSQLNPVESTTKIEPSEDGEVLSGNSKESLEAAGIRIIDFAFVSKNDPKSLDTSVQNSTSATLNPDIGSLSEPTESTAPKHFSSQNTPQSQVEATQYTGHFSPLWSQPSRTRRAVQPILKATSEQDSSNPGSTGPGALQTPPPSRPEDNTDYTILSKVPKARLDLRHSDGQRIIAKVVPDLSGSLDGQTAHKLRQQFSAVEFLEYYRSRQPRDDPYARPPPIQISSREVDSNPIRTPRASNSSMGDTPPKYQRVSRGSNNSRTDSRTDRTYS